MNIPSDYDVIIVGGRVSGSTLAAYLGQAGVRVLMLERSQFPEEHPASSPMIQPSTLAMLDEIGADERAYAHNTPKIRTMYAVDGDIKLRLELPEINGRDYGYAIDRARFDAALWDNALRFESVVGLQGFSMTNLLWDEAGEQVIGIEGKAIHAPQKQQFTARLVVGADGRFSTVARKVEAQERDKHDEHPTTLYYGYWEGVQPIDDSGEATSVAYVSPQGTHGYLIMDSADGTAAVCIEGRADVVAPEKGELTEFYINMLQQNPQVWQRLEGATLRTKIHGMRKIGNMFREAGGAGWALVGDAYHQKDPIDGQGIYDSVYTSRALGKAIIAWHSGRTTWADALAWYDKTARAKMTPQYEMTRNRIEQTMYPSVTLPIPKNLMEAPLRWLSKDPQYQHRAALALNRQIDPRAAADPRFMMLAMLRGSLRELSERLAE